jgi:hypothetical protein
MFALVRKRRPSNFINSSVRQMVCRICFNLVGDPVFPSSRNIEYSKARNQRVPARPWTVLAGDGLVSELVSAFFTYDHCSGIPFVDQECFLADMRAEDITQARFCSPFLVNAICALRCVSVDM